MYDPSDSAVGEGVREPACGSGLAVRCPRGKAGLSAQVSAGGRVYATRCEKARGFPVGCLPSSQLSSLQHLHLILYSDT